MAQILFINPPYLFDKDGGYVPNKEVWKPLGILYLASALLKKGISVEALDLMPKEINLREIINLIKKTKPLIIGITGTTQQIKGMIQLGQRIKEKFGSKVFLIAGGPHVSCDPEFISVFPFFNAIFIGEGEETFPQIAEDIINGKKVEKIIYGQPPSSLDKIPYPQRDLLNNDDYLSGPWGGYQATIHTTRGCPFRCVYCSSPVERISKVRYRSPKNVVDEIEDCLLRFKTKFFIFTDDTFSLDQPRVKEICREITRRNLKIKWNCETRANLVDKKLLSLMKKAGCVEIFFGVESGSERIRNQIINKRISDKDLYQAFEICRNLGITTNAFLMAGFPTETKEELQQTGEFVFKAKPDIIGIHITTILPGSIIFDLAVKEGRIKRNVWHQYAKGLVKEQPVYIPKDLTLKEIEDFQKELYHRFYFRPSWLLKRFNTSFSSCSQFKSDIKIGLQLLVKGRSKGRSYKEEDYFK